VSFLLLPSRIRCLQQETHAAKAMIHTDSRKSVERQGIHRTVHAHLIFIHEESLETMFP